jgi:putative sigma-54 modulation protein
MKGTDLILELTTMTINITHRGIELTEAIRDYTQEKMESLEKYGKQIRLIDVEVGKTSLHHHKGDVFLCEATIHLEDGHQIRLEREAEDLYKAIEKVRDHARNELAEHKEKRIDREKEAPTEMPIEE